MDFHEESPSERRSRLQSIWMMHIAMGFYAMAYTVLTPGIYGYMKQLLPPDEDLTVEEEQEYSSKLLKMYGFIFSADALGLTLGSILLGWLLNKINGHITYLGLTFIILNVLSYAVYSMLSLFPENARYPLMMVCRFTSGFAAGMISCIKSYLTVATFPEERTEHLALNSGTGSVGALFGPIIQAAVSPLQCTEKVGQESYIALDMYTACSWIGCGLCLLTWACFLPFWFKEHNLTEINQKNAAIKKSKSTGQFSVKTVEDDKGDKTMDNSTFVLDRPDYTAAIFLIISNFINTFNYSMQESLTTPLLLDQFGYTESEATFVTSVIFGTCYFVALFCYFSIKPIAAIIPERILLFCIGFAPLILGRLFFFPFPNHEPPPSSLNLTQICNGESVSEDYFGVESRSSYAQMRNVECIIVEEEAPLCQHCWCEDQPGLSLWQLVVGQLLIFAGNCYLRVINQTLFTKILGPRPIGLWMGMYVAVTSVCRIFGPAFFTTVYDATGLYILTAVMTGIMIITAAGNLAFYKRLIPFGENHGDEQLKVEFLDWRELDDDEEKVF